MMRSAPTTRPRVQRSGSLNVRKRRSAAFLALAVAAGILAASFVIHAVTPQSQSGDVQLQLGDEFYAEGRYRDALEAYQKALTVVGPDDVRAAKAGIIQAGLRIAEFD